MPAGLATGKQASAKHLRARAAKRRELYIVVLSFLAGQGRHDGTANRRRFAHFRILD